MTNAIPVRNGVKILFMTGADVASEKVGVLVDDKVFMAEIIKEKYPNGGFLIISFFKPVSWSRLPCEG